VTVPDLDAFTRLARPGVAVPVVRELHLDGLDPLLAFDRLAHGQSHAALLETREAASDDADISVVAFDVHEVVAGSDVLDVVQASCCDEVAAIDVDMPRFVGGAIGMLAHEHVRSFEPTVPRAGSPHPAGTPDAVFLLTDMVVVFEHRRGRAMAISTVRVPVDGSAAFDPAAAHAAAVARLDDVERRIATRRAGEAPSDIAPGRLDVDPFEATTTNVDAEAFEAVVEEARELVCSGECVQIVVSRRFERPFDLDPIHAYRTLRAVSPAPYHVLLRLDDAHVVGASPEQLVGVADERVVTHPIAGTRPRGATVERDEALERDLLADPKERAEHMMLVDLGRNDVGRVAVPGSVTVPVCCEVERFSHVMHLVSRVDGALRPGLHPVDALRAAFPAGTLTGAPKVRAMQHVARLEPQERGAYGGVIGYVGHGRVLDMAITIRSAVLAGGMAYVQAGAGVVASSVAADEEAETRHKARAVLLALAAATDGSV